MLKLKKFDSFDKLLIHFLESIKEIANQHDAIDLELEFQDEMIIYLWHSYFSDELILKTPDWSTRIHFRYQFRFDTEQLKMHHEIIEVQYNSQQKQKIFDFIAKWNVILNSKLYTAG